MKLTSEKGKYPQGVLPKKRKSFQSVVLMIFSLLTGSMLLASIPNLIPDVGLVSIVKSLLIACSATVVSYSLAHFALEKGTELTAIGFVSAGIVSIGSILIAGLGLFASSYAGLVINSVRELKLQAYGRQNAVYIDKRVKSAAEAGRVIPLIRANEAEFNHLVQCESRESCVSGRKKGGRGPITRTLEEKAQRAASIAAQLENGERVRQSSLSLINSLLSKFQKELGDTTKPLKDRREKLAMISGQLDQAIATLDEAMPISLLRAYAQELSAGVTIPGRPNVTRRINTLLGKHAANINSVLSTMGQRNDQKPRFPAPAGVSSTFLYVAHFLPVAALTFSIEVVLPLSLWLYVYLGLVWQRRHASQNNLVGKWREEASPDSGPYPNSAKSRSHQLHNGATSNHEASNIERI